MQFFVLSLSARSIASLARAAALQLAPTSNFGTASLTVTASDAPSAAVKTSIGNGILHLSLDLAAAGSRA
jgi:hypothetical protein